MELIGFQGVALGFIYNQSTLNASSRKWTERPGPYGLGQTASTVCSLAMHPPPLADRLQSLFLTLLCDVRDSH